VDQSLAKLPSSLREAADLLEGSTLAKSALGEAVVEFYVRHARIEHQAFSDAVTDWERVRYFERI
jgi:glutamine synthetase